MKTFYDAIVVEAKGILQYPYDTCRATFYSERPIIAKISITIVVVLYMPILYLVATVCLASETAKWTWNRVRSPPPLMEPGNTFMDHLDATRHFALTQTRQQHRKTPPIHKHYAQFPAELIELVLQHTITDLHKHQTLLACALVCPCWLRASRAQSFKSIFASKKRAYTLMRILRSPHCSFRGDIQYLTLEDYDGWNTSGALLDQFMRMKTVAPVELNLRLDYIAPIPTPAFTSKITHLTLNLTYQCAFRRKLSRFARFISTFTQLEDLWIEAEGVGFEDDLGSNSSHQVLSKLRHLRLSSYCDSLNSFTFFSPSATLLLYLIRGTTVLESLDLGQTSIRGFSQEALEELSHYFRSGGCAKLKHLSLTCSMWNNPDPPNDFIIGPAALLPLHTGFPFPVLESLVLRFEFRFIEPHLANLVTPWITSVLRRSPPTLNEVFFLDPQEDKPFHGLLTEELGFTGTIVVNGMWIYHRGEGLTRRDPAMSQRVGSLISIPR